MGRFEADVDAAEVGFDPARLSRIDEHFARYVDDGRLAGWHIVVTRRGQVAHSSTCGLRDVEAGVPVEPDTLWRIYSMTKPVTSVAAMSLCEQGAFALNDEVARYLPAFADMRIYRSGPPEAPRTAPATEPIRMWHLLSHTSGMTYGFTRSSPVDDIYRLAGSDVTHPPGLDLAAACDAYATLPLLFEPGSGWNYSVSHDVLGRVLEVLTGQPLDEVFRERVLAPLAMDDTRWWVDGDDVQRLAALYALPTGATQSVRYDQLGQYALRPKEMLDGGGGLVSTASDYHRFTQMLLRGGELDGARVLSPRTVRYMTQNHLPGGALLTDLARGQFAEVTLDGMGYGLGFGVLVDPVAYKVPASAGEFSWGGLASTGFWVDPAEEITAMVFTQLVPSSTYPLRTELRQLVYGALVD